MLHILQDLGIKISILNSLATSPFVKKAIAVNTKPNSDNSIYEVGYGNFKYNFFLKSKLIFIRLICDTTFVDKNCKDKISDGQPPTNKDISYP